MSIPSSPQPSAHLDEDSVHTPPSISPSTTRAVAIIKNHALQHRLSIEPRIYEAGFEVRAERAADVIGST